MRDGVPARRQQQARAEPAAPAHSTPAPVLVLSTPMQVLNLQRSAGNAAVSRLLSSAGGRTLARDAEYPQGRDRASGHWGRPGAGLAPEELASRLATDLPGPETRFHPAAPEVLNGYWIVDIVHTVERLRQLRKLDALAAVVGSWTRVRLAVELVRDPENFDATRSLAGVSDAEYADLTGTRRDGTAVAGAPATTQSRELMELRIPIALEKFAADRQMQLTNTPPAAAATPATSTGPPAALPAGAQPEQSPVPGSPTAPGAQPQLTQMQRLQQFDAKYLPALERMTANRSGPRWAHRKPWVQEAILAALQLRGVTAAMNDLGRGQGDTADIQDEARRREDVSYNWCGFFAAHSLIAGGMQGRLHGGMASTSKVYAFFRYGYTSHPDVIPRYIRNDQGAWQELHEYHAQRQSPRRWIPTQNLARNDLDIRPGDVLTISVANNSNREKPFGDHIVLVHSYDQATGRLFTIGGNDGGYVVRNGDPPARESQRDREDRERREAATGVPLQRPGSYQPPPGPTRPRGHVGVGTQDLRNQPTPGAAGTVVQESHVAGIGRPSLVDFEQHDYARNADGTNTAPRARQPVGAGAH